MKPATLTCILLVAFGYATTAQKLTLLPQIGIENPTTKVKFNDVSISPACMKAAPNVSLRLDYQFKGGHGPFIGLATSSSVVSYNFSDLAPGKTYTTDRSSMKLAVEAGYMYSSKPIYFGKSHSPAKSVNSSQQKSSRHPCAGYASMCHRSSSASSNARSAQSGNKGWYMSIQPAVGAAFTSPVTPAISTSTEGTQPAFTYKAGNWNTALISGVGFEFGKGRQRMFAIGINYLRGIGNFGKETVTQTAGTKTSTAVLRSTSSAWSVVAGIPITLSKTKKVVKQKPVEPYSKPHQWRCGQYRSMMQ